ncbi:MAG: hypothetical protein WBG86_03980 [Polyangiales bacterium]
MHMWKIAALYVLCVVSVAIAGCGHESAATQQIMNAAAVDLSCDQSVLEFVEDKPMEKRVSGCGRALTYMYQCNPASGGGQTCKWKAVPDRRDKK